MTPWKHQPTPSQTLKQHPATPTLAQSCLHRNSKSMREKERERERAKERVSRSYLLRRKCVSAVLQHAFGYPCQSVCSISVAATAGRTMEVARGVRTFSKSQEAMEACGLCPSWMWVLLQADHATAAILRGFRHSRRLSSTIPPPWLQKLESDFPSLKLVAGSKLLKYWLLMRWPRVQPGDAKPHPW